MNFKLEIVTPYGPVFNGEAEKIIIRTTEGDVGILANHADYVASLSIGVARVYIGSEVKKAACAGGMISVTNGIVRVVSTTFEWADEIDYERAQKAKEKAQARLEKAKKEDYDYTLAEMKLKKALARLSASGKKA